jgi:hypothetical protein
VSRLDPLRPGLVSDPVPLYRVRLHATPVEVEQEERAGVLSGLAAILLDPDDWGRPRHVIEWRQDRRTGALFEATFAPGAPEVVPAGSPDPRVADVLARLDGGPRAARAGDPVALLAQEVRRLRGEPETS